MTMSLWMPLSQHIFRRGVQFNQWEKKYELLEVQLLRLKTRLEFSLTVSYFYSRGSWLSHQPCAKTRCMWKSGFWAPSQTTSHLTNISHDRYSLQYHTRFRLSHNIDTCTCRIFITFTSLHLYLSRGRPPSKHQYSITIIRGRRLRQTRWASAISTRYANKHQYRYVQLSGAILRWQSPLALRRHVMPGILSWQTPLSSRAQHPSVTSQHWSWRLLWLFMWEANLQRLVRSEILF